MSTENEMCPLMVSFDAAERLLDEFGDIHEEPAVSKGVIAISLTPWPVRGSQVTWLMAGRLLLLRR
jgi:hypothetical protein